MKEDFIKAIKTLNEIIHIQSLVIAGVKKLDKEEMKTLEGLAKQAEELVKNIDNEQ